MHTQIEKLYNISGKKSRLIIGLMSGTSLDGLDVALCNVTGSGADTKVDVLEFETVAFDDSFKAKIREVFSKEMVNLQLLTVLNPYIAVVHAGIILNLLNKWKVDVSNVDLIASHGQTVYHAPKHLHQLADYPNGTLQIGDGDHLAVATGIITISDFRQKNIAAGGEGAPLAPHADELIFREKNEDRILLNIGGIGNFTFLPANSTINISADTGPGNTMIDAYVQQKFPGKAYDEDGEIAASGKLTQPLLDALLAHPYFKQAAPKTTGPEMFNLEFLVRCQQQSNTFNAALEDVLCTLTHFSAITICNEIELAAKNVKCHVYASGGGMHNAFLMELISKKMPQHSYHTTHALNVLPDAKEAVVFAVLANECVAGNAGNHSTLQPAIAMGKISLPL